MSAYIDLGNLVRVILWSLGSSIVLALAYGIGVHGLSRVRTAGGGSAVVPRVAATVGFAVFGAAIILGIWVMSQK